jgi:hypothetical protein
MKLNVKRSLGKLEHLNTRVPAPLRQRLDSLRKRAEDRAIDYTATLVAMLEEFADALEAQLNSEGNPAGIPEESRRNLSNGTDQNRA